MVEGLEEEALELLLSLEAEDIEGAIEEVMEEDPEVEILDNRIQLKPRKRIIKLGFFIIY